MTDQRYWDRVLNAIDELDGDLFDTATNVIAEHLASIYERDAPTPNDTLLAGHIAGHLLALGMLTRPTETEHE